MTVEDLNNYRAEVIEHPMSISLGDSTLYVPSAPLSGPVLILILNILKGEKFLSSPAEGQGHRPSRPSTLPHGCQGSSQGVRRVGGDT